MKNELVNSFNLPIYMPTSEEVKEVIETNGNFDIDGEAKLESAVSIGVISITRQRSLGKGFSRNTSATRLEVTYLFRWRRNSHNAKARSEITTTCLNYLSLGATFI